jgi:hypothetical protein
MNNFSKQVTDFWNEEMNGDLWYKDDSFTLMINEDLEEDGQIMLLESADKQRVNVVITSAIMKRIGLMVNDSLSESVFLQLLKDAGISLHGADYIYYYQEENKKKLLETASIETIRLLRPLNILFRQPQNKILMMLMWNWIIGLYLALSKMENW